MTDKKAESKADEARAKIRGILSQIMYCSDVIDNNAEKVIDKSLDKLLEDFIIIDRKKAIVLAEGGHKGDSCVRCPYRKEHSISSFICGYYHEELDGKYPLSSKQEYCKINSIVVEWEENR